MTEEFSDKCEIQENPEIGRYVRAADNIKAGETLLLEKPVLILATAGEKRCCNCFKYAQKYCGKCHLSPLCLDCTQHSEFDCNTLAAMTELKHEELKKFPDCYGIIKCLLLSENPEGKEDFSKILQLMSHLEKRRKSAIWQERNKQIVQPILKSNLKNYFQLGCKLDEEFLQHLCGVLDVNTYEIRAPDVASMSGLYLKGSLLAHQCCPNANVAIDDLYRIKIYANRDIDKEEMVTNCYTNVLLGTDERRHILQEGKYFLCNCPRCADPTELGSHMSSFICAPCAGNNKEGYIVKQVTNKKWQCSTCTHSLRSEQVETIIDKAKEEVFHAQDDLRRFEILLAKLSTILHKNHYIMVDIKQNIANILRTVIMNSLQRPGRRVYERKVRLCQELVMVLQIIQPGISRLKAIALYELANASAELYRLRFGEKELTEEELQRYLRQCEAMFKESIRMLLYEPPQTPEGELMKSMMGQLKDLKNDIQMLEKSVEVKV
ncbi:SET domain-containing protein SmydA-8-like [Calliphora vicina]|uniref:SET domain-containing protein SmydA-8-like n=1 Tax=Calliphora vicina TaxID=7373 RepID=UPI00325C04A1